MVLNPQVKQSTATFVVSYEFSNIAIRFLTSPPLAQSICYIRKKLWRKCIPPGRLGENGRTLVLPLCN